MLVEQVGTWHYPLGKELTIQMGSLNNNGRLYYTRHLPYPFATLHRWNGKGPDPATLEVGTVAATMYSRLASNVHTTWPAAYPPGKSGMF